MEVVYYFDSDLEICPVREYFKCFIPSESDKVEVKDWKNRILHTIFQKIQFVKENPGKQASFLGTLHNHNCIEIKNGKDNNTVIRILYFIFFDKIVLLHAFEKPNKYDTDKIKKEIDKNYSIADLYINKFKKYPNNYEEYEK